MKKIEFMVDDLVELISESYEDSGYHYGDTGKVVDVRYGRFGQDLRIE